MRRREFITLLGGAAAAWPLAARAQQGERMRRVGVLVAAAADDPEYQARNVAFLQSLQQLGWADGRNVRIDTRWATTNSDDVRRHAADWVHDVRIRHERKMAGAAQGDRAWHDAGGGSARPGHRLRNRTVRCHPGRGAVFEGRTEPGRRARCR